jgi:ATP-binding cassette subfamily B protein
MAIDGIENNKGTEYLAYCGGALMITAVIQAIFRFFWRQFFLGSAHRSVYDLRKALFSHLLKLPGSFFSRTRTGDLMSRLTNDIQEIRFMLGIGILITLDTTFYLLSIPFIMLWLSTELTLLVLIPLVLIPITVSLLSKTIHDRSREVQARLADLSARTEESFSGIRIIKGFHTETSEIKRFARTGLNYVRDKIRLANIDSIFQPGLSFIVGLSMVILLFFGGKMVIAGTISLGSFIAFQTYMLKLSWPMMAIGWIINLYQRSMASMERCLQVLKEPPAESNPEQKNLELDSNDLELKNVSFAYPDENNRVLEKISFKLESGKTLGITGPVGCGKTTLLRLLSRMFPLKEGKILIDNKNIQDFPLNQLRALFAYVPQETFLFGETIRENILFSRSDKTDQETAMHYALKAGLGPDLKEFPNGLETTLGERGVNLSGGQKQRISLARALASERPFLLLDDCTSAVDTETEKEILKSIRSESEPRTCIIVSHRMVSLQNADMIVYLENGRVIESGSHSDLLTKNGRYAANWKRQRLKDELERSEQ